MCYPLTYHNIAQDIPADKKRVVREAYLAWWVSTGEPGAAQLPLTYNNK